MIILSATLLGNHLNSQPGFGVRHSGSHQILAADANPAADHDFSTVNLTADATAPSYAHIPAGWRRTAQGWQHTANWENDKPSLPTIDSPATINQWLETQRRRQPAWAGWILETIRAMPPLLVAVIQIVAIGITVLATSRHDKFNSLSLTTVRKTDG